MRPQRNRALAVDRINDDPEGADSDLDNGNVLTRLPERVA